MAPDRPDWGGIAPGRPVHSATRRKLLNARRRRRSSSNIQPSPLGVAGLVTLRQNSAAYFVRYLGEAPFSTRALHDPSQQDWRAGEFPGRCYAIERLPRLYKARVRPAAVVRRFFATV